MISVAAAENGRALARASLGTALILLCLLLVRFFPSADLFSFSVAGALVFLLSELAKPLFAELAYLSSSLLAFSLFGPTLALPFTLVFGAWAALKIALELAAFRFRLPRWLLLLVKLFFALLLGFLIGRVMLGFFLTPGGFRILERYAILRCLLIPGLALLFLIYDVALSLLARELRLRLPKLFRS